MDLPGFWYSSILWVLVNYLTIFALIMAGLRRLSSRPVRTDRERGLLFGTSCMVMAVAFAFICAWARDIRDIGALLLWLIASVTWFALARRYTMHITRIEAKHAGGKEIVWGMRRPDRRSLFPYPQLQYQFLRIGLLILVVPLAAMFLIMLVTFQRPFGEVLVLMAVAGIFAGLALLIAVMESARWMGAIVKMIENPLAELRGDDPPALRQLSRQVRERFRQKAEEQH